MAGAEKCLCTFRIFVNCGLSLMFPALLRPWRPSDRWGRFVRRDLADPWRRADPLCRERGQSARLWSCSCSGSIQNGTRKWSRCRNYRLKDLSFSSPGKIYWEGKGHRQKFQASFAPEGPECTRPRSLASRADENLLCTIV